MKVSIDYKMLNQMEYKTKTTHKVKQRELFNFIIENSFYITEDYQNIKYIILYKRKIQSI